MRPRHADPTPTLKPMSGLGHSLTPHSDVTEEKSPAAENSARTSVPDKLAAADPTPHVQHAAYPACQRGLPDRASSSDVTNGGTISFAVSGKPTVTAQHTNPQTTGAFLAQRLQKNKLTKC
ncbi:hypothetical protein HPB50_007507 [Hyalomma asiaticum]|uniref:Uncharacterized protein n=1 Tax=Hyalomma asiaticum TaxID=266040 RepID=A0ACB7TCD4_HYAAI|nr:hypothetical protein HPB50_007507 [Hyalomma asiaticum]